MISCQRADYRTGCDRRYKHGTRKGLLAMYGTTSDRDSWFALDQSYWQAGLLEQRPLSGFTEAGIPVAACDTLEDWGNATMRARMADTIDAVQPSFFRSGPVHMLGASAGGLSALNFAKRNPEMVQTITLLIPVLDVQAVWDFDRSNFKASITGAYGGRPPAADNPIDYADSLDGIPIQIFYSTNDEVTTVAETTTFAERSGAVLRSMGAVGHFWGPPWGGQEAAEFVLANGRTPTLDSLYPSDTLYPSDSLYPALV